jgi:glycosyltransferase involved in cell wall biosynthesis
MRWADVVEHANVSLRGAWPLLLVRRPWVVSHHSWYCRSDGRVAWQDRLKRWSLRFADASIAVSAAIAADVGRPSEVIPNAYRDSLFRILPHADRSRDLVFVGRLVSDKGADLLLQALARLAAAGRPRELTVIGTGPESDPLARLAHRLGLTDRVHFLGPRTGYELVEQLNRHRVLVVPSRYAEPFGIVALEGIACGCAVIGTEGGGLPDAIGPCGVVVPNGDAAALADAIDALLSDPARLAALRAAAAGHLSEHRVQRVGERYLAAFERAREARSRG